MPKRRRIECENCLAPITTEKKTQRFCSPKCRLAWHHNPRAKGKLRRQVEQIVLQLLRERGLL